jgi:hypothetical protein
MRATPIRYTTKLFFLIALCLLFIVAPPQAFMQGDCPPLLPGGTAVAWPQNATVYVHISQSFTTEQRVAIQNALIGWQNSPGNNSGVGFVFTPTPTALPFTVDRIEPGGGQAETEARLMARVALVPLPTSTHGLPIQLP